MSRLASLGQRSIETEAKRLATYLTNPGSVAAHNIFSATHSDAETSACVRGSLMVGDATPGWVQLAHPAVAAQFLRANAVDPGWAAITNADIPSAIDVDPGTCTVATGNVAATPHTHAVTTSSNPGAAASILATDGAGDLTLQDLTLAGAVLNFMAASTANIIDNVVDALHIIDDDSAAAGSPTYARISTTDGSQGIQFNFGENDVDFRVAALGVTHAFSMTGSDGHIGVGVGPDADHGINLIFTHTDPAAPVYGQEIDQILTATANNAQDSYAMSFTSRTANVAWDFTGILYGVQGFVGHYGSGTLSEGRALWAGTRVYGAGDITTAYGLYIYSGLGGSTGNIETNYGIIIKNPLGVGSGTITGTNVALHIEDQTRGATNYAIYVSGANSYHAGRFAFGSTISALAIGHFDQGNAAGAIPAILLDQGDVSEQCIKFRSDGVDRDINLWTIDVTGTPTMMWDESENALRWNEDFIIGDFIGGNYVRFDADGDLTFAGTADYLVGGNRAAFKYSGDEDVCLFFNSTDSYFEFRQGVGTPVFRAWGGGAAGNDPQIEITAVNIGRPVMRLIGIASQTAKFLQVFDSVANQLASIDEDGVLLFENTGDYHVGNDRYAFRAVADTDAGLFFNITNTRYEFRDTLAAVAAAITLSGRIGAGVAAPLATGHFDQASVTGAIPVVIFDQADVSEEIFEFISTIGIGNAIEAVGAKTLTTTHFIKVTLPGGLTRYFPVGTIA